MTGHRHTKDYYKYDDDGVYWRCLDDDCGTLGYDPEDTNHENDYPGTSFVCEECGHLNHIVVGSSPCADRW